MASPFAFDERGPKTLPQKSGYRVPSVGDGAELGIVAELIDRAAHVRPTARTRRSPGLVMVVLPAPTIRAEVVRDRLLDHDLELVGPDAPGS